MLRGHTVLIRIGIHTSDVIGTVLGSRYELVGKAVGVAEKVQEGCKPGGVAISSTTKALCPDFKCASNGKWVVSGESVAVVGKRPEERVDFVECFDLDVDLKDTKEG
jgi:class 3 adenylate cyclase